MMATKTSRFREWVSLLCLHPSNAVRRAATYLEANGQEFLIHFGTANAIDKAREHWRGRRKARR